MRGKLSIFALSVMLIFVAVPTAAAESWFAFDGVSSPEKPVGQVISSDDNETVIKFTSTGFWVEDVDEGGVTYQKLRFPGYFSTLDIGRPQLPVITEIVAVPGFADYDISVVSYTEKTYSGYHVWPFQTPLIEGETPSAFDLDVAFYGQDVFYPDLTAQAGDPQIWRDIRVVVVKVNPIRFNPHTGDLSVYTDVTVRLTYSGTAGKNALPPPVVPISQRTDAMYDEGVINYGFLGLPVEGDGDPPTDDYDYLIIADDGYVDNMADFIAWKNAVGLSTQIVPMSVVGSSVTDVKSYIQQEYDNNAIEYVLLVGNESDIPGYTGWGCFSDYYYTLMDGVSDTLPDLAIGRFCVHSDADVDLMVGKSIMFEQNPPYNDWLEKSLLVANAQSAPGKYQECKENIRLALETQSGTYLELYPDFTTAYGAAYAQGGDEATNADVIAYIDAGQRVVNYRGHGSTTSWSSWNIFYESFGITQVNQLNNGDMTPVVFSIACWNNNIESGSACLGEAFTLADDGAVSVLSATRPSYTWPNHTYDEQLYAAVFDEGINSAGDASNLAAIRIIAEWSNSPYGNLGLANAKMYIWLGDPSLNIIYSPTPPEIVSVSPNRNEVNAPVSTNLSVTFSVGIDETTVNSSTFAVYGSMTGLCSGVYSYNEATLTATFNPSVNFAAGEVVTGIITTGIESAFGLALVEGTIWSFMTATSGSSPGTFYYDDAYTVDNLPMALYSADLDGDNDLDLAVANRGSNLDNVSILLNDGAGNYGSHTTYEVDSATYSVTAADFDGDGDMDLAATDWDEYTVSILENGGNGVFGTPVVYTASVKPSAVRAADLDGDTDLDVVVTNWGIDEISVFINNGDGTFAAQSTYTTAASPNSLHLADFDDDGAVDVVTSNSYGNISVLLNNGSGEFPTSTTYTTGICPEGVVAVDLDGDGDLDLATANKGSYDVSILLGNGDGTFAAHSVYDVGSFPVSITCGDLDGDDDIDLAVSNQVSDNVSVLMNNGNGTFAAQTVYAIGDGPYDIIALDVNGDGDLDLATVNMYTDEVAVLRNRTGLPPAAPYPTSPPNGISTTDHTPTLNWSDVIGADTYDVIVDNDSTFGSINRSYYGRTVSYWTVSPSLTDGWWYWKARAVNEAGPSPWSTRWKFRVYTSTSCPILYSHDGAVFNQENPLLTACEKSGYKDVVTDYYHVGFPVAGSGNRIQFQLRELEDEITYLDEIQLITVDHADNTKIACSVDGLISAFGETVAPLTAIDHNGIDRKAEISAFDDNLFASEEAGYLIVTFPNTGSNQPMFAAEVPQKPYCPIEKDIYIENKPVPDANTGELMVSILTHDGQWRELPDVIPSRSNTSNEMVISPVIGDLAMDVITLRFSWEKSYSTDAVLQYVPSDEIPVAHTWNVDTHRLVTAKPAPGTWNGFADGQLILRRGDVFEFGFAVDEPVKAGQTRDYIIRAVGRYTPDYAKFAGLLPNRYQLYNSYPNPFNPLTTIAYDIPKADQVSLEVFNILGQRVATLVEDFQEAGHYEVVWDSKDESGHAVASGVYFYKLTTKDFVDSRKMLLLK